jgi:hypothetical protein
MGSTASKSAKQKASAATARGFFLSPPMSESTTVAMTSVAMGPAAAPPSSLTPASTSIDTA